MIERHVDGCVIGYDAQQGQVRTARTRRTRSVTGKISAILLAVSGEPELSMTAVARQARLPVSTTHRLLSELVEGHVLDRGKDGPYSICVALRSPVGSTERAANARSQISLVLEDVGLATGLRARFGVWNGLGVSYLERSPGSRHGSCRSGLGVLPAHATALGKAMLAHAPLPVVETVLEHGLPAYAPHTLTTAGRLHRALANIRAKMLSVSRGEYPEGEIAIATAVFGPDGAVVGAIELAVDDLVGGMRLARPALVVAARSLSHLLAADPAALPTGSGAAPLLWRADPTSAALSWCVSGAAG
jgi:DNA-binding IclR family transcriptional regulator